MGRVGNWDGDFITAAAGGPGLRAGRQPPCEFFQAPLAGQQSFSWNFATQQGLGSAMQGAEILVRVVGNQDQVDAGRQGFAGHPADAALIDGAHVEIVGDQDAVVAPVAAQQAVDHGGRVRGGMARVDPAQRDVAEHDRRGRLAAQGAEG